MASYLLLCIIVAVCMLLIRKRCIWEIGKVNSVVSAKPLNFPTLYLVRYTSHFGGEFEYVSTSYPGETIRFHRLGKGKVLVYGG